MENINQNETTSQTQSAQILKALKNGERLTHLDAEKRFNCLLLGARIYDLKNDYCAKRKTCCSVLVGGLIWKDYSHPNLWLA